MKKTLFLLLLVCFFSCQSPEVEQPTWINPIQEWRETDGMMKFRIQPGDWSVLIQTSSQPIVTDYSIEEGELKVAYPKYRSFVEGQAFIVLKLEGKSFAFPVFLNPELGNGKLEDIRSPKTLNTDSSLVQQQMRYSFGKGGNLIPLENGELFEERYISQGAKVGTFAGESDTQLSSFYITAGTPESIPMIIQFDEIQNEFTVQAGPLEDAFQNQIPNGTLLTFTIQTSGKTWIIEEVAREGFVRVRLSSERFAGASIHANVAQVFSETLTLIRP
ncbi:hypothetical protein [Algoriphagus sediminis]|uniref:Uncharacterized protein n=1 Tax=Algoriphagus sediminis TaxID=3057113 RepID=A0ABT7YGH1_9BACT|nr:hypothetical protein [Algoriphagus sediminis]MDN3205626.1 hypothetical protein [Algoriphagus sediminis]